MSATYTQDTLRLQVKTPLGPDKLLVRGFSGEEYISAPFRFDVEMVSEDDGLDFSAIVGEGATVTLKLNDGTDHHFHGLVERFVQEDKDERFTTYHAELRPWLWMLTKTADCRVYQNKTTPEIVKALFGELAQITGNARNATAVTLRECELLELTQGVLEEFMTKYPRFGAALRYYAEGRINSRQ